MCCIKVAVTYLKIDKLKVLGTLIFLFIIIIYFVKVNRGCYLRKV